MKKIIEGIKKFFRWLFRIKTKEEIKEEIKQELIIVAARTMSQNQELIAGREFYDKFKEGAKVIVADRFDNWGNPFKVKKKNQEIYFKMLYIKGRLKFV